MSTGYEDEISAEEKVEVASNFIVQAPPGEFNEVFSDVRALIDNDELLRESIAKTFIKHNTDQFTPYKSESLNTLITSHNLLPNGRFCDPKTKQSFKFDHLSKKASDLEPLELDDAIEAWRDPVEKELNMYIGEHYKQGKCCVFGKIISDTISLVACIESHLYNPQNYWNGKLRSEWKVSFPVGGGSTTELAGVIKTQVHYYEDGNVQLLSSKDMKHEVKCGSAADLAAGIAKLVREEESKYQEALLTNYQTMSQTTFKALRRILPVTRMKVDWNKIASYKLASELQKS